MALRKASYKAGDEVESKCTKCKLVLAHTIVAMVGDAIARVKCNTCGGEHTYRAPPSASEATAKRRRAERKTSASEKAGGVSTASEYDGLMRGRDSASAPTYSPSMTLQADELISHPKFGIGLVTEVKEGQKAHVAFPDGGRILVFGR
jgi:hypothetical protein